MRLGSLCTGAGMLDTAIGQVLDVEHAWFAEKDPAASTVLAARFPDVPNLGDITAVDWDTVKPVDVLSAGFPCQDVSCAGRRAGITPDSRSGLWLWVAHVIARLRPPLVVLENVRGLLSARADSDMEPCSWCLGDDPDRPALRALGAVLGDLADCGYDATWYGLRASDVGAAHPRFRVFIVATPSDAPRDGHGHGHGHARSQGGAGVSAAAVGGAVRPDGLNLLPTPAAARSGRNQSPSPGAAVRPSLDQITALLPTPAATLGRGTGFPSEATARERYERGTRCLDDAVALLPTPAARVAGRGSGYGDQPGRPLSETVMRLAPPLDPSVALLPTLRATDGSKGGPNQRGSSGDLMLPSAVMLLPTPTVADSRGSRNATAVRSDDAPGDWTPGWSLSDIAHADRWGEYAPAIRRWEHILGRPAPDPTEPGTKGQPRLAPRFVEWLMGRPDGWVTDVIGRNDALRVLGNGVVSQQAAYALSVLLDLHANTNDGRAPAGPTITPTSKENPK